MLCQLANVLMLLVNVYTIILLVYAVVSWIPDLRGGRWAYYLSMLVDPVLAPIRRVIPPLGGFDIAFLLVLLVLQLFVRPELARLEYSACIPLY